MSLTWQLLLLFGYIARVGHAYSSGPPSCFSMVPAHGVPSQTSPIPYILQTAKSTYSNGETIQMTLVGQSGETFRGFLIQVVTAQDTVVGSMAPTSGPPALANIQCGSNADDGLAHTEASDKTSVVFIWTAPSTANGPLTVRATVVQTETVFWSDAVLATLNPEGSNPVVTLSPQVSTTQAQAGQIQYDSECGSSKGCFIDCNGDNCNYMVTWQDADQGVIFELYGKPKQTESWIAVGFSKDARMGDDSVTECVHNSGAVQVFNSYNPGKTNSRLTNSQAGLSDVSGSYVSGVLSCKFTRAKRVDAEPNMFDLEQDWNIMFAHGNALSGFGINTHSLIPGELPPVSAGQVDYQSFAVIGEGAKYPLVKVHGCLMILAWVVFTGVGIVAARYYKTVWPDKTILKLKVWFQIHRACMVTALVLDVVAFVIIFVEVKGYSEIPDIPGKAYLKSHPILGIIVTFLCLANPVMAFFRPGPNSSKRPLFNWAHWSVGVVAYILSALCICFGFELGKASTPDYAIYIMVGYVVYIVVFSIVCELHDYMAKREMKGKIEAIEMTSKNGTNSGIPNERIQTKKKGDRMKNILLAVHIASTGAFALSLVVVVAVN